MKVVTAIIDKTVEKLAEATSLLMILLVVMMCFEVIRRYFFNAPTIWGLEFTTFVFGIHFVMGYSYTEYFDGHVRVDIFSSKFPPSIQDLLYIVLNTIITLPLVTMLAVWAWDNALTSTRMLEELSSAWAPPIWPVKLFMALGFSLLSLQVFSNICKRTAKFVIKDANS